MVQKSVIASAQQ